MRNVDLNRIGDFLRIVEHGNITRAAEALGDTKAKLSRNLALLEEDLGVQLIYRTTRQFKLTEVGAQFYQEAKGKMVQIEESILNLKSRDEKIEGKIKVTAPDDLGTRVVTQLVSEFKKIHPRVEFELVYTSDVLNLVKLGVDIAFRIGQLKDSSLVHRKVGRIDFVVAASPGYLERSSPIKRPEDLVDHQTIAFSGISLMPWKLLSHEGARSVRVQSGMIANHFSSVLDLAVMGHGVCLLPRFLAEPYLAQGVLVHILKGWSSPGQPVQVTLPQQKNTPQRIRSFFDFSVMSLQSRFS